MTFARHFILLGQGIAVWVLFWLAGLPSYYQQYSLVTMAVFSVVLSVAISLVALLVLLRGRSETRLRRAVWISFYFTVPLAIVDWLYCGIYLGYGATFLVHYWYVTVFYFIPWLTFIPTALLLRRNMESRK